MQVDSLKIHNLQNLTPTLFDAGLDVLSAPPGIEQQVCSLGGCPEVLFKADSIKGMQNALRTENSPASAALCVSAHTWRRSLHTCCIQRHHFCFISQVSSSLGAHL